MLTWTEKGERLDAEMHSIHLFSDAYTRQVEALTQKSPFRRLIQSTHKHKGGKWVFSELKNEPVLSHFYCITSCLLAHCPFGRFFLASFPLYSGGSDATLAHPR